MVKLNGWNRLGVVISLIWLIVITFILIAQLNYGPGHSIQLVEDVSKKDVTYGARPVTNSKILAQRKDSLRIKKDLTPVEKMDIDTFLDSPYIQEMDVIMTKNIVDPFDSPRLASSKVSGMFDDLIPKPKTNYQINFENTLMLALFPIFFCWIFAYLTIWSIRWVVDGFKGDGR